MFFSASARSHHSVSSSTGARLVCIAAILACWQLVLPLDARAESPADPAESNAATRVDVTRVQRLVDDYLPKLGMSAHVETVVVPRNALMMSVEPTEGEARFRLSVDQSFLHELSDDELSATVAHELGHVWIFTHHPFLQTEALANDVAMRLVPKDTLQRVYEKVYERLGTKGTVARFVGD
jgi:hypothetical protein